MPLSRMSRELASQPDCWREAERRASSIGSFFSGTGGRMALVGCGTSFHIAAAAAGLREEAGLGGSDPFPSSEAPRGRRYRWVLAISRTGTTTETLRAMKRFGDGASRLCVSADPASPLAALAERVLDLGFADESSIVQTRFATTALAAFRVQLDHPMEDLARSAEEELAADLDPGVMASRRYVFIGQGWAQGLAGEASLKMTEAAAVPCQWYPALELRHGPLSSLDSGSLVWAMGPIEDDLATDIVRTGALLRGGQRDPMVELVSVQRHAEELARRAGRDPDGPPWLGRSVILG